MCVDHGRDQGRGRGSGPGACAPGTGSGGTAPSAKRRRSVDTCVPPGGRSTGSVLGKRSGSPSRGSSGMGDITLGA